MNEQNQLSDSGLPTAEKAFNRTVELREYENNKQLKSLCEDARFAGILQSIDTEIEKGKFAANVAIRICDFDDFYFLFSTLQYKIWNAECTLYIKPNMSFDIRQLYGEDTTKIFVISWRKDNPSSHQWG